VPVSGVVTVDGVKLESGAVSFRPFQGGSGTNSAATVQNGEFQLAGNQGLALA
jgi:hypothetical protein